MTPRYRCLDCATIVLKLYETRNAVWKKDLLDEEDKGDIDHYGDRYYTWKCSDHKCSAGSEWSDTKPQELEQLVCTGCGAIYLSFEECEYCEAHCDRGE